MRIFTILTVAALSVSVANAEVLEWIGEEADGWWTSGNNWHNATRDLWPSIPSSTSPGDDLVLGGVGPLYLGERRFAQSLRFASKSFHSWVGSNYGPETGEELVVTSGRITVEAGNTAHLNVSLAGNAGLIKDGPGNLILAPINTFVGAVILNEGQITAIATGTLGINPITVNGGVLRASGDVGTLNLKATGILLPAYINAGTLNTRDLTLDGGTLVLDFRDPRQDGVMEFVNVTGGVSLNANISLLLRISEALIPYVDTFAVIANDGFDPILGSGRFVYESRVLNEGDVIPFASFAEDGRGFRISYHGGTGNDVVFQVIPEPSIVAFGFSALPFLCRRRVRVNSTPTAN